MGKAGWSFAIFVVVLLCHLGLKVATKSCELWSYDFVSLMAADD